MTNSRYRRPCAAAATAATAAASWVVVARGAGVHLGVHLPHADPSSVGLAATIAAATAAAILGWALVAILNARASRPRRTWIQVAVTASAASLALPAAFAVGTSAAVGLVAIHLAVAAVAIGGLAPTVSSSRHHTSLPQAPGGSRQGRSPSGRGLAGVAGRLAVSAATRPSPRAKRAVAVGATSLVAVALAGAADAGVIKPPPAFRSGALFGAPMFMAAGSQGGARLGSRSGPGVWSGTGAAWMPAGSTPTVWPSRTSKDTEYFDVASTVQQGPGAIVLSGPLDQGGVEHPGRRIDNASFADGTFRIDHSAGSPTVHVDRATCVGTITQAGPFEVIDATGRLRALQGHRGSYRFDAIYTTGRDANGCTSSITAYIATIHGVMGFGPSAAARLGAGLPA